MVSYVSPEIEEARDNPNQGSEIRVAIVPEGDVSSVRQAVEETGGVVERALPSDIVIAVLVEERLSTLCEMSSVASISHPDNMRVLS